MKFFRKLHVCFFLFSFFANAEVSINFPITSEGYWYCKAYSNLSFYNSSLSYELCLKACDDLSALSPAETICFLSGILDNDSSAYKKILFWNSLKKIKIPKEDLIYLKKMNEIFKISFLKHKEIFEKIKKFWGVKKDCRVYCFLSTSGRMGYTGAWIANFHEKDRVLCTIFLNLPPTERSIDEYMSMIAHEFSHAMCDVAYGRIKFGTLTKTLKSKNAVVAGWYMNEVLAILLGNCIAQESFLKKKVDPNKEEYCARGVASALYPLVKKYFDTGKTLDETFVKEFVKAFDRLYPDGYTNPNLCLYDFCLIHSDDIKEHDLMFALSEKTTVAAFDAISFSNLKNDVLSAFQKKDNTLLVIFNENKELDKIRHIIPKFNDKNIVNIIHENGRTYIFLRTNKNSLKDTINKLFEK